MNKIHSQYLDRAVNSDTSASTFGEGRFADSFLGNVPPASQAFFIVKIHKSVIQFHNE